MPKFIHDLSLKDESEEGVGQSLPRTEIGHEKQISDGVFDAAELKGTCDHILNHMNDLRLAMTEATGSGKSICQGWRLPASAPCACFGSRVSPTWVECTFPHILGLAAFPTCSEAKVTGGLPWAWPRELVEIKIKVKFKLASSQSWKSKWQKWLFAAIPYLTIKRIRFFTVRRHSSLTLTSHSVKGLNFGTAEIMALCPLPSNLQKLNLWYVPSTVHFQSNVTAACLGCWFCWLVLILFPRAPLETDSDFCAGGLHKGGMKHLVPIDPNCTT